MRERTLDLQRSEARYRTVIDGAESGIDLEITESLLRCDQMQGYLFGPPMDRDKVEILLRTHSD